MRLVAALLGILFAMSAAAQPYPSKPVRVTVPFPPGQAADKVSPDTQAVLREPQTIHAKWGEVARTAKVKLD